MSSRELERVEVMGRVASGDLKLSDAAVMLELSYRQTKRLWRRYLQVGRNGLKHGNAGRPSNRSKPLKLRRRVLNLVKKKYSGSEGERFGPTLAAEHLAEEDGVVMDHVSCASAAGSTGALPTSNGAKSRGFANDSGSYFFGGTVGAAGVAISTTAFHRPSRCFFQTTNPLLFVLTTCLPARKMMWSVPVA